VLSNKLKVAENRAGLIQWGRGKQRNDEGINQMGIRKE
jgi:hypothetical protein